jgi:hypothetical protein
MTGMRDRRAFLAGLGRAAGAGLLASGGVPWLGCTTNRPAAPASARAASGLTDPASLEAPASVGLRELRGYYYAQVNVNQQPAGLWLIDTGSSITIVESGVAGRLSLDTAAGTGRVRGIGGTQAVRWVQGATLGVANVRLPVNRLGQMNLYTLNRAVSTPMSGILGFDALRPTPFTLDPRGRGTTLVLHPQSGFEAEAGMRSVPLRTWGGVAVVEGDFGGGAKGPLVVDTGQDRELTLPESWAVRWPGMFASPQTGPGRSVGIGGPARGREGWVKSLRALGWAWRDVPVKIEPGGRRGRIGMKLLGEMVLSFDAAAGKLWAKPAERGDA